jgi:hypothetical protein
VELRDSFSEMSARRESSSSLLDPNRDSFSILSGVATSLVLGSPHAGSPDLLEKQQQQQQQQHHYHHYPQQQQQQQHKQRPPPPQSTHSHSSGSMGMPINYEHMNMNTFSDLSHLSMQRDHERLEEQLQHQ